MSSCPPNPTSCKVTLNYANLHVLPQYWPIDFRFYPTKEQYDAIMGKEGYWLCQIDADCPQNIQFIEQQFGENWADL